MAGELSYPSLSVANVMVLRVFFISWYVFPSSGQCLLKQSDHRCHAYSKRYLCLLLAERVDNAMGKNLL